MSGWRARAAMTDMSSSVLPGSNLLNWLINNQLINNCLFRYGRPQPEIVWRINNDQNELRSDGTFTIRDGKGVSWWKYLIVVLDNNISGHAWQQWYCVWLGVRDILHCWQRVSWLSWVRTWYWHQPSVWIIQLWSGVRHNPGINQSETSVSTNWPITTHYYTGSEWWVLEWENHHQGQRQQSLWLWKIDS